MSGRCRGLEVRLTWHEEDRDAEFEGRLQRNEETQEEAEPQDEEMGEINYVEAENVFVEWVMEIPQLQAEERGG